MKPRPGGILVVCASLLLGACGGGDNNLPQAESMTKVADGDQQRATAGNRLDVPLTVVVRDAVANPLPRGEVLWEVTEGQGALLSDTVTVSDGTGQAKVFLTLGPTEGSYAVQASLSRKPAVRVQFSARAVAPPSLSSVSPTVFGGGDTIVVSGSMLTDSVQVEIGGVLAEVIGVSVTQTGLLATVPKCLVPGPVSITARVGLASSPALSGTYQASNTTLRLGVGERVSALSTSLGGCATFPDAGPSGAEYLMVPQADESNTPVSFRLMGDSAGSPVTVRRFRRSPPTSAARFHEFLREWERDLVGVPREAPRAAPAAAPIAANVSVGDTKKFRVCSTASCRTIDDFPEVQAEVMYVGARAVVYQDKAAPSGGFTAKEFQDLGRLFDDDLYGVDTRAFGAESDIDRNGRVLILFSPKVNGLTPKTECELAIVTGFFFAFDIDPAAKKDSRSNKAEIFYAMVPDPNGTVTCELTKERVLRLVPVTLVHEFQHMINFYQHVLLRAGNTEATWLNEAMSHLAEELGAFHFQAAGDQSRFTSFAIGDLLDAFRYLQAPGAVSPIFDSGSGTLEERGASWLFVRWVADQFGAEVVRRLSETGRRGVENMEAATGEPISGLLSDWLMANYASDLPGLSPPARLRYQSWKLRDVYASLHDQDSTLFDVPFPIVPLEFQGGTFNVSGTIAGGSGEYFLVQQAPGQRGFSVRLTDPNGNELTGTAVPRLNVLRTR
ncbi:MAG: IPT/TIG domain-containing protein [Gemmatimonadales bacterium]